MPLKFPLSVAADCHFGSKWLNNLLLKFGFAVSYDEVARFKQSVIQLDGLDTNIPKEYIFLVQFVGDNTDHEINTIDGRTPNPPWFRIN